MSDALYVYGLVKSKIRLNWKEKGLNGENVYGVNEGDYTALVHDCAEKPYISEESDKIKELIIIHNHVLDKAMGDFGGAIPLPFNTIIKRNQISSVSNLRKWISANKENLGKKWGRILNKKEYGIRVYYDKKKVLEESSNKVQIKKIKTKLNNKSLGLNYLMQGKIKAETNDIFQNILNQFKQKIYNDVKRITPELKISPSRILINEAKDLLMSLSVLVGKSQINEIGKIFSNTKNDFSFQLAGPFAPYSFV